jgi:HAD superfamily hydrolase (TIGR01509 family)
MTPPHHAVIFDMDGVLADSEPVYAAAMNSVLEPLGLEISEADQRHVMGLGIEDCWRYLSNALNLSGPTEALVEGYNREVIRLLALIPNALPGVHETLHALKQRNVPIAVASSSLVPWIDSLLGALHLQHAFDALVSRSMVPHGKPAPDVYLLAAERLGVDPARCVAVEDTPNGLASARAAGMFVVQTRSASTAFPPLEGANLVLDSLLDFPLSLLEA